MKPQRKPEQIGNRKRKYIADKDLYKSLETALVFAIKKANKLGNHRGLKLENWPDCANHVEIHGETAASIIYIDSRDMRLFENFKDFDCRSIKIINYKRPAIGVRYTEKHKYCTKKNLSVIEIKSIASSEIESCQDAIDEILNPLKSNFSYLSDEIKEIDIRKLKECIKIMKILHDNAENYEVATSNWDRNYVYPYATCRYYDSNTDSHNTINTHLIQGDNIIFIDMSEQIIRLTRDDEETRAFLSSFDKRYSLGKKDLFWKIRT